MALSKHENHGNILQELDLLDQQSFLLDGKMVKPSQCYYFSADPLHILYNTNCPEQLKAQVDAILSKYTAADEGSAQQ